MPKKKFGVKAHHRSRHSPHRSTDHRRKSEAGEAVKLKRKMQKTIALVDYYNDIGERKITSEEQLKEVKSKMEFTQKQILRLCLESKKIIKDVELKNQE